MNSWNTLGGRHDTRFVIRNGITGTYIHKSLFRIMEFRTHFEALTFIRQRGLNRNVYFVEVKHDGK